MMSICYCDNMMLYNITIQSQEDTLSEEVNTTVDPVGKCCSSDTICQMTYRCQT